MHKVRVTCDDVIVQKAGAQWKLLEQLPGSRRRRERLMEGIVQLRMSPRRIQRSQKQVAGAG